VALISIDRMPACTTARRRGLSLSKSNDEGGPVPFFWEGAPVGNSWTSPQALKTELLISADGREVLRDL